MPTRLPDLIQSGAPITTAGGSGPLLRSPLCVLHARWSCPSAIVGSALKFERRQWTSPVVVYSDVKGGQTIEAEAKD